MALRTKGKLLIIFIGLNLTVLSQSSINFEHLNTLIGKEQSSIDTNLLIISARLINDSILKKTEYVYSQSMQIDTNENIIYLFLSKTKRRIIGQPKSPWIIKDVIKIESFTKKLMRCSVSCECTELDNIWHYPVIERLNYETRLAEVTGYFKFDYQLEEIIFYETSLDCIIEIRGDIDYCW